MILSFQLTMPNIGSWNGKWSGAGKKYYKFRRVTNEKGQELDGRNFYYDWSDGWGANVKIEKVDSTERKHREKESAGFCGYEWMIESILKHGEILADHK